MNARISDRGLVRIVQTRTHAAFSHRQQQQEDVRDPEREMTLVRHTCAPCDLHPASQLRVDRETGRAHSASTGDTRVSRWEGVHTGDLLLLYFGSV